MSKMKVAPKANKIRKKLTIHNDTRVDNYYWLNQREDENVIKYLDAENEYLKSQLKHTEGLQKTIYNEIVARIN